MLLYTLFGMMVWNSKLIQTPEKLCPHKHPSWMQVYFLTSSEGPDSTIRNLDLKYFSDEDAIEYTVWNDDLEL